MVPSDVDRPTLQIQASGVLQIAELIDAEGAGAGEQAAVAGIEPFGLLGRDEKALAGDAKVGGRGRALELALLADM